MKSLLSWFLLGFLLVAPTTHAAMAVVSGRIDELPAFPSQQVEPRTVYVWLPDGYTTAKRYAVLYMHDGQMLFDPTVTWNRMAWEVDRVLGGLIAAGRVRECIVVGIANLPEKRFAEYYPQKAYEAMPPDLRRAQVDALLKGPPLADRYLRFLVDELKPQIDARYSTLPGRDSTFVMGSSMGGLISLYALCEYPDVFGGAACLSTHTPMADPTALEEPTESAGPAYFRAYLREHLPPPASHRLYMDHGDQTLDRFYPPYQRRLDEVLRAAGYTEANWVTRFFPGTEHSERAWAARLEIPLQFLLGK